MIKMEQSFIGYKILSLHDMYEYHLWNGMVKDAYELKFTGAQVG